MRILQKINGHEDLLKCHPEEQTCLCAEIRNFLVDSISKTGGHLASNLGIVELSVAIETVYNTNIDRLVFDVGHQSYVHKLLTGRQADFGNLRQFGGIAGFPKPGESDADAFVAGHASSSVSIALGMARARTLMGGNYDVVAVIGDGAATGGMVYEAMNDAAVSGEPMVIILNDNEMSIAPNVGGFAQHLSRLRTKESYLGFKQTYRNAMSRTKATRAIYRATRQVKDWAKRVLLNTTIFENMGLTYLGPVDGNDLQEMISLLRLAKGMKRPVVVHVRTQKGKGYGPAEENPARFHGVGKFDPASGRSLKEKKTSFSDTFGETMLELGSENHRLCAITAAMPDGTGLLPFMQAFPERTFDVGIAEEHAVSMAGGLAKQGMVPVVAIYSTFLQRSFDQIMQDIAMLKLHVVLAVDRAGLVGEDGETHHGVFDVGYLRMVPGMTVLCPSSRAELKDMLRWAVNDFNGPVAVRYPRGGDGIYTASWWDPTNPVEICRNGKNMAIVTYGTMVNQALIAADILEAEGVQSAVITLKQVCPLPVDGIKSLLDGFSHILVVEEVVAEASIHDAIARIYPEKQVNFLNLGNAYVPHGDMASLYKHYGLDGQSIAESILEVLKIEN